MRTIVLATLLPLLAGGWCVPAVAQPSGLPSVPSAKASVAPAMAAPSGAAGAATDPAARSAAASAPIVPFTVVGDAIPEPLGGLRGDAARGRALVANRQVGLCLLCHAGPIPEERFQGNLAPDLAGAGARWSAGQLRLRLVDARRANPQTIMPAYYRADGHERVGPAWRDKTLFSAEQIEDVVAYLATLRS